jgi:hypothetical protein
VPHPRDGSSTSRKVDPKPAKAILQVAELFDGLDEVQFWIKDRRGRYLHVNRAFLLNYDLQEPTQVVGKTDYDLSPAFLADQFVLDDERVLKGHKVAGRIELVGGAEQAALRLTAKGQSSKGRRGARKLGRPSW